MSLGKKIEQLRTAQNMTQEELAKRLKTTKQTIWKYENGIVENIPLSRISELARILNTTPAYLTGWEDTSTTAPAAPKGSERASELLELIAQYEAAGHQLTDEDMELIQLYLNLSPEKQTAALYFLRFLASSKGILSK